MEVIKNVYGFFVTKEEFKLNKKNKSNTNVVYVIQKIRQQRRILIQKLNNV